ncbi:hypothetical protein WJX84_005649 [Apatococcus fuscideae]|uniref:Uncharacterized protein n=1 Tax=Apatococcus fuscideae TaxID=2026836 RepID=A0AAW1RMC3_9CHLO
MSRGRLWELLGTARGVRPAKAWPGPGKDPPCVWPVVVLMGSDMRSAKSLAELEPEQIGAQGRLQGALRHCTEQLLQSCGLIAALRRTARGPNHLQQRHCAARVCICRDRHTEAVCQGSTAGIPRIWQTAQPSRMTFCPACLVGGILQRLAPKHTTCMAQASSAARNIKSLGLVKPGCSRQGSEDGAIQSQWEPQAHGQSCM